jgi:hypothetical protein
VPLLREDRGEQRVARKRLHWHAVEKKSDARARRFGDANELRRVKRRDDAHEKSACSSA